jgi:hypothetical protein
VDKLGNAEVSSLICNRRGAAFSGPVGNDDGEVGIGNSPAEGQKRTVLFERRMAPVRAHRLRQAEMARDCNKQFAAKEISAHR